MPLSSVTRTSWPSVSPPAGFGKRGAHQHGIGGAINRHVDEIDLAGLVVGLAVGKAKSGLDRLEVDLVSVLLRPQKLALAYRKRHIHRILAHDDGEWAAVGADDIALGDVGAADPPGNRRDDFGIAKIDFGGLQVGLVAQDLAFCLLVRGKRLIPRDLRACALCQQVLRPRELRLGEHFRGLAACQGAFRLLDGRLEQPFLDAIEGITFLDRITLLEQHRLQEALYARPYLDAIDRFDAARQNRTSSRWTCARP